MLKPGFKEKKKKRKKKTNRGFQNLWGTLVSYVRQKKKKEIGGVVV